MTQNTLETKANQPMGKVKKSLVVGLWGAAITSTALALAGAGIGYSNLQSKPSTTPEVGYKIHTSGTGRKFVIPENAEVKNGSYIDPETKEQRYLFDPLIPFFSSEYKGNK